MSLQFSLICLIWTEDWFLSQTFEFIFELLFLFQEINPVHPLPFFHSINEIIAFLLCVQYWSYSWAHIIRHSHYPQENFMSIVFPLLVSSFEIKVKSQSNKVERGQHWGREGRKGVCFIFKVLMLLGNFKCQHLEPLSKTAEGNYTFQQAQ